ncbi:hypothetical protein E3N88_33647 [Mikania micrantha]|uniref:SWIM-type domain-containing protein n=1 Tax=Mikania micrantha TaxID=192012 RepID=A0A5N6MCI9_9ASTR|nr:hypothetical protein E3N88_33647 [Mikania micrantha]
MGGGEAVHRIEGCEEMVSDISDISRMNEANITSMEGRSTSQEGFQLHVFNDLGEVSVPEGVPVLEDIVDEAMDSTLLGDWQIGEPLYDDTFDLLVGNSPLKYLGTDMKEHKPQVGMVYSTWDEVVSMYEAYSELSGFGVRSGAYKKWKGEITHRVLSCNRAGKPKEKKVSSLDATTHVSNRCRGFKVIDCKALIRLKAIKGSSSFLLYEFAENHNHELVSSDNMDLTRKGKHLNFDDINFVHTMSLHQVGPTVAHGFNTALKGGHQNMQGTRNVYRNISRDIRLFIRDRDVQLFLQRLKDRSDNLPNFEYEVLHDGRELKAIFWADDVSRTSYQTFGDVVAFDATYSTNKYNMIFVPFTGVDHHKKCVSFGADQDPAMRIAVSNIFKKELIVFVSADLYKNSNIRSSIHKLVWNVYLSPSSFEEKWVELIHHFNLQDNVWLNDMFGIRNLWVPAYFREIPMCCLMKTTSRCESSNASFKVNSSFSNTLVQFLMCFDSAIDQQRYNQRILEFNTNTSSLQYQTELEIEKHAGKLYTQNVFKDVQKEIHKSVMVCFITNVDVVDHSKFYTVSHMNHNYEYVNEFKVAVHMHDNSFECSCMGFTRIGLLCRHIFCVFRILQIREIPDRYVSKRWQREVLPSRVYSISNRLSVDTSELASLRNEVMDCVNVCVDRLCTRVDDLSCFAEKMKEIKKEVLSDYHVLSTGKRRAAAIEDLVGRLDESDNALMPPQGIRNKGCGTNRRLVGPGELSVEKAKKPHVCAVLVKRYLTMTLETVKQKTTPHHLLFSSI